MRRSATIVFGRQASALSSLSVFGGSFVLAKVRWGPGQCPLFGVERCPLFGGSKCISSMVKSIGGK